MELFFPEFKWRPALKMHTKVKLLGGDANVDHTQIIGGDTVKLLGGIYPRRVSAPLLLRKGGVEDKVWGAYQGHKKIRGQGQGPTFREQTLSRPRTGMLEAKDQGHNAEVFKKKKIFVQKHRKFSRKFSHLKKIAYKKEMVFVNFPRGLWRAPRRKTNMFMNLAHF